MWISRRGREAAREEKPAQIGVVTLEGEPAAVMLAQERRNLPVFSPGGYCWRPAQGQAVLVLKTGDEAENPCIAGAAQRGAALAPGEVLVSSSGACGIFLNNEGEIHLTGSIFLNGTLVSAPASPEGEE